MITVFVHYKGEKTQRMKKHQDDVAVYLAEFLNSDLAFLGLPAPEECACAWKSGIIKCMWSVDEGSYLQKSISAAFEVIDAGCLLTLSISMLGLSSLGAGKAHWITAPRVKHPPGYTPQTWQSSAHAGRSHTFGKAPSAPKSIALARAAASPIARPGQSSAAPSRQGHEVQTSSKLCNSMFDSSAPSGTQQSNNRGFPSTSVLPDPSRLTTTKPSLWDEPKPLATSTDSKTLADTKVKVEERDVVLDHHRHYATSASRTTPYAPALNPSLSSVSSSAPSILSTPSAATNSSSATQNGSASSLTREIWDVRREIAALAARETVLEEHLKRLGSRPAPEPSATKPAVGGSKTAWLAPSDVISKLRAQLRTEYEARKAAEHALRDERQQRELAAAAVADIHRECRAPFVVPALVDAFVEISRITGDVLAGL